MNSFHVVGGGSAGVLAAVLVAVANHFGWHLSDPDAMVIGGAAVSAGVGIGHVIDTVGIFGAFKRFLHGAPKAA